MRLVQLLTRITRRASNYLTKWFLIIDAYVCLCSLCFFRGRASTHSKIIFATQYYASSSLARQQEILECLEFNSSIPWLTEVVLFCEHGVTPPSTLNHKCRCIRIDHRASYNEIFSYFYASEQGRDSIVIIANSDIFLCDGLQSIFSAIMPKDFVCLNRFDSQDSIYPYMISRARPGSVSWSQDTWLFNTRMLDYINLSALPLINLGLPSCENSLAWHLYNQGITISNPCLGIRTVHNHRCQLRSYTEAQRLQGNYAYPRIQTKYQFIAGRRFSPYLSSYDEVQKYLKASSLG